MIELLFLVVFAICFILILRKFVPIWQIIIAEFYLVTFLLFLLFSGEEHPYYEAIDPAGLESYEFVDSQISFTPTNFSIGIVCALYRVIF